jgi:signal transduction histidine kinase
MLAYAALKSGRVGVGGSTGAVLERGLRDLRDLVDRSLAEVRIESGMHRAERFSVSAFVEEIELGASLDATDRGLTLTVGDVPDGLEVEADRSILAGAITNLLDNAFKFSQAHGHVSFMTSLVGDRILFEVEDACGGLAGQGPDDLFRPFHRGPANRDGLGLGLSISRRGIAASGGDLRFRDVPGKGCVFTIELPRHLVGRGGRH